MKKQMSTSKKLLLMLIIILVIFGSYNLAWYLLKYRPYTKYISSFHSNNDSERERYYTTDDYYSYVVKMPPYLGFESGFLGVSSNEEGSININESGEIAKNSSPSLVLYIWPQIIGDTEYGIMIINGLEMQQLHIDRNINYIPYKNETDNEIKKHEEMINDNYKQIYDMINGAKKIWGDNI